MGSKNYLNVTLSPRSVMSESKQKSCESYDSSSSNYSQFSEKSNPFITNPEIENLSTASVFSSSEFTAFDFSTSGAEVKRNLWQKAVASLRGYKDKKPSLLHHKSGTSPEQNPQVTKCEEMDPVYHLLKCAAGYNKCDKVANGGNSASLENNIHQGEKVTHSSDIHLNISKGGCTDSTCPCNQPEKLPVVKKEDLGQQAKRELSIKKCTSVSPRQSSMNSQSSRATTAFAKY